MNCLAANVVRMTSEMSMSAPTVGSIQPVGLCEVYVSIVEAIVLAIVQGLTEFLPVSSSGHLVLGALAVRLGGSRPRLRCCRPRRGAGRDPFRLPTRGLELFVSGLRSGRRNR